MSSPCFALRICRWLSIAYEPVEWLSGQTAPLYRLYYSAQRNPSSSRLRGVTFFNYCKVWTKLRRMGLTCGHSLRDNCQSDCWNAFMLPCFHALTPPQPFGHSKSPQCRSWNKGLQSRDCLMSEPCQYTFPRSILRPGTKKIKVSLAVARYSSCISPVPILWGIILAPRAPVFLTSAHPSRHFLHFSSHMTHLCLLPSVRTCR